MINLFHAQIEAVSLHRIGNKHRNEGVLLSETPQELNDESRGILREFFLKPFREKEENYYTLGHEADVEFNEVYKVAGDIFREPSRMQEHSLRIAKLLYEQSDHPHIKNGELFVVRFSNILLENEKVEALGIFKSEIKQEFLQFEEKPSRLEMKLELGVNLNKLDKGCLIFNVQPEEGYKVLSVDSNRYDAKYWLENFLGVQVLPDDNFYTRNYLKFCQNFAKDVVLPAEDKQQEVLFMNRAVNHFAKNDAFEETQFLNEVMENPDLIPEFKHYKVEKGPKYSIEDISAFPIANKAVSESRKKIKNVINLDTNVQIRLDFINPESAERFVEKGWDEEKQMYYYLVYFNRETKS